MGVVAGICCALERGCWGVIRSLVVGASAWEVRS
jgi:hypothetical protein